MKWLLILILHSPNSSTPVEKLYPGFNSKEECQYQGQQAVQYYRSRGMHVRFQCATGI